MLGDLQISNHFFSKSLSAQILKLKENWDAYEAAWNDGQRTGSTGPLFHVGHSDLVPTAKPMQPLDDEHEVSDQWVSVESSSRRGKAWAAENFCDKLIDKTAVVYMV